MYYVHMILVVSLVAHIIFLKFYYILFKYMRYMNGVYVEKTHSKHIIIDTQKRYMQDCETFAT
jgi:hypothetical protein